MQLHSTAQHCTANLPTYLEQGDFFLDSLPARRQRLHLGLVDPRRPRPRPCALLLLLLLAPVSGGGGGGGGLLRKLVLHRVGNHTPLFVQALRTGAAQCVSQGLSFGFDCDLCVCMRKRDTYDGPLHSASIQTHFARSYTHRSRRKKKKKKRQKKNTSRASLYREALVGLEVLVVELRDGVRVGVRVVALADALLDALNVGADVLEVELRLETRSHRRGGTGRDLG